MFGEDSWILGVVFLVLSMGVVCFISSITGAILDSVHPERLKRYDLEIYKQGVKDSATKIKQ